MTYMPRLNQSAGWGGGGGKGIGYTAKTYEKVFASFGKDSLSKTKSQGKCFLKIYPLF